MWVAFPVKTIPWPPRVAAGPSAVSVELRGSALISGIIRLPRGPTTFGGLYAMIRALSCVGLIPSITQDFSMEPKGSAKVDLTDPDHLRREMKSNRDVAEGSFGVG